MPFCEDTLMPEVKKLYQIHPIQASIYKLPALLREAMSSKDEDRFLMPFCEDTLTPEVMKLYQIHHIQASINGLPVLLREAMSSKDED